MHTCHGNACGLPTVYQVESWQMFGVAKHEHIYTTARLSNMHDTMMSHAEAIIYEQLYSMHFMLFLYLNKTCLGCKLHLCSMKFEHLSSVNLVWYDNM